MVCKTSCPFCAEVARPEYYRGFNSQWPFPDRIMYRSVDGGALVFPPIGPLLYPYALVIPCAHYASLASCPKDVRRSMFDCLRWTSKLSSFVASGGVTVFEHGGDSTTPARASCQCISHGHVHLVGRDVGTKIIQVFLEEKNPTEITFDLSVGETSLANYLFAANYDGSSDSICGYLGVCPDEGSQYFRRVLAEIVGTTSYDWRQQMNPKMMERLYREAKEAK